MGLNKLNIIIRGIKKASKETEEIKKSNNIEDIISNIKRASYRKDNNELKGKINNIKSVFLTNWEKNNVPFIENLLSKIDIDNGIPIPILSICGQGTQEVRFTKYLAYFIDPSKKHGLKDHLLQVLFSLECKLLELDLNWSRNCKVIPEIKLGEIHENDKIIGCFADIGIEGEDYIIIVEQKILSDESKHPDSNLNQLERYNFALDNNPKYKDKKKVKIYLTPNESYKNDSYGWLSLTHEELIDRGMKLLKSNDISRVAKENLKRLLIDLAVGPYQILEQSLDEIILLGERLMIERFNLGKIMRLNKLVDENRKVIKILLEG